MDVALHTVQIQLQGSHRLEKALNLKGSLEKALNLNLP